MVLPGTSLVAGAALLDRHVGHHLLHMITATTPRDQTATIATHRTAHSRLHRLMPTLE